MQPYSLISFFSAILGLLLSLSSAYAQDPSKLIDETSYQTTLSKLSGAQPIDGENSIDSRFTPEDLSRVRTFLAQELFEAGYQQVVVQGFSRKFKSKFRDSEGRNISVSIPGKTRPEEIIIIGAHYDSAYRDVPGANDNGTGTAAVLELAKAFKASGFQADRTIKFVFFDAEEVGIIGSQAFFSEHVKRIHRGDIAVPLFINLDMLGNSNLEGGKHLLFNIDSSKGLIEFVKSMNTKGSFNFEMHWWGGFVSDNLSARDFEIPNFSISEWAVDKTGKETRDYKYYHSPADTIDKVNIDYALKLTAFAAALVKAASQSSEIWNVHDIDISRHSRLAANTLDRLNAQKKVLGPTSPKTFLCGSTLR
ncbi:MAG: M28 family metallopeptidase [Bdellovibrionales bacterium]